MTDRTRIGAGFGAAPYGGGEATLPPDLLAKAGDRVRIAALAFAGVWAVALVVLNPFSRLLTGLRATGGAWPMPGNALGITAIALSLALAWGAPRLRHRPNLVINLGLAYEVAMAAIFAVLFNWEYTERITISWAAVVILVYPAIAPASPRKILVTSIIAGLFDPVLRLAAFARTPGAEMNVIQAIFPFVQYGLIAGLALVPATIIRRLGKEVRDARELGSYRLEKLLGEGGMGQVYRASHRYLARPAAVKLISPRSMGDRTQAEIEVAVERFKREAGAASSLSSPHTIELYDFGVSDDGIFFYVMELLDGLDLQEMVEKHGPMPPGRVIHFLRQACDSLAEAHHHGMVHRDIKPANIFACRVGLDVDFAKVLDFGIVKVRQEPARAANLTSPELAVGTPAYLAPEALSGAEVDGRSDLYALGCVGFFLLTGE
ncbi:MAG TPA: serine/threonine-protein kinase, partial [Gemmatimonadales bacterium]|nr:serine/threonine-protein kinase [Gemmatimonadales bacterium]